MDLTEKQKKEISDLIEQQVGPILPVGNENS